MSESICRIIDAKLGRLLCLLMGVGFYTAGFIKVMKINNNDDDFIISLFSIPRSKLMTTEHQI